jgi:hypothetical protein
MKSPLRGKNYRLRDGSGYATYIGQGPRPNTLMVRIDGKLAMIRPMDLEKFGPPFDTVDDADEWMEEMNGAVDSGR